MSENQPEAAGIDLHKVLLEIEEEVREKRASGELSVELERELDMVFARFAPAGAVEGDFEQLLARAEQQSFIDLLAPNESVRKGVPQVKRVIQKSIRWYMRYVVEQFTGFAHTITKAVAKLAKRVDAVDQLTIGESDFVALPLPDSTRFWTKEICGAFSGIEGRVLHARCRSGELVEALRNCDVDAYGVEPDAALVAAAGGKLDLRPDDERQHLGALSPSALAGLVLSGSVDVLPTGAKIELLDAASLALQGGAKLVIVADSPHQWALRQPVLSDLAPGKPLQAETWSYLLTERGFTVESVHTNPENHSSIVVARR